MTETELFAFMDVFRGLERVFPRRGDEMDRQHVGASYFKALRKYPLSLVSAGADICIQRNKHFPKPAEWIDAIPRQTQTAQVPTMSDQEAREYHRAESLGYEDVACQCRECVQANVNWKPLRFVPDFDRDDQEIRRRDPLKDRIVTRGHWAHGQELQRWYEAKGAFYREFQERVGTVAVK